MQINWVEILLEALTNAVFITAAVGALAFLSRSIIERWLSRNLEKYKADLQAANARELEKLRTDLRLAAYEYEIRFAELHKQQAKVIAEFYELLVAAEERIRLMGSILVSEDEASLSLEEIVQKRAETAHKEINVLIKYYNKNRLYFKESTCKKINQLLHALQDTFMDFKVASPEPKAHEERWREAQFAVAKQIPEIMQSVEKDFRELLGHKLDGQ